MRRCDPSSRWWIVSVCLAVALAATQSVPAQQVVPGTNVNMVSGTTYPDGDPYLQRQNEPSSAVSTRNPLHILGGANDYRTVDIPFPSNSLIDVLRPQRMNSDAWVGLFKSFDGGQNWRSTLIPGYPQDPTRAAPLWGYDAATDPYVRAGTNGMFYYSGLAFDRGPNAPSAIFVARFIDMNNLEAGDPIVHLNTRIVDSDPGTRFLDKNAIATDIPRTSATCTFNVPLGDEAGTVVPQTIPAGNVYVAYTAFTGSGTSEQSVIMFSRSTDCGMTWSTPRALSTGSRLVQNAQIAVNPLNGHVYVSWRRFRYLSQDDAVMVAISMDGGATFSRSVRVAGIRPFDQPTALTIFRSNGFQTMTFDGSGRAYLAWSERGYATDRPDPVTGDARIVISTSTNGSLWTVPQPIQRSGLGHQLMPALSFHAGKLRLLYYDLREDISGVFGPFVDEFDIITANSPVRHTLDVFVGQASPGAAPAFTTARLSDYAHGFFPDSEFPERLQFNPPNLPLFRQGTTPFMGDYIDLAPAPAYVQNPDGSWSHNTALGNAVSHAFWTDNRDVRPPTDGDWTNYTPPRSPELGTMSRFDPSLPVPDCSPAHVASRNQNIYTARVTEGLFVSAPGNNKPLGDFQRAFAVVAENATGLIKTFRLTIDNQPPGGEASFLQFSLLTFLDVQVPPFSSVARSVFATSTDEDARIHVTIVEITAPGGAPVVGGLSGSVVLNPEPGAPRLQSPRLQSPRLQSPLLAESYDAAITNALIAAPRLQSPRLQSPTIVNPRLQSDSAGNPRLQSDSAANPGVVAMNLGSTSTEAASLTNPRLQSPRLQSADLTNAAFSDTSWEITNDGNTTAAYTLNLVLAEPLPSSFTSQLLVHKTTTTPAAIDCNLAERTNTVLLANIPDPDFIDPANLADASNPRLQSPRLQSPTLALAPGESATLTLRVVDMDKYDGVVFDPSAAVIPAVVAHSVNTEDIGTTEQPSVAMPLTITTADVPLAIPGQPYTATLSNFAGVGTVSCQLISGEMPQGLTLSSTGVISGTPTSPGNYRFTVRCTDANGNFDDQTLSLQVDPPVPGGFTAAWNGATTDWADPLNWSPRGVPGPTARVYISASVPVVPTLTRNETIQDLFVEPGATVNTNGFDLTITRNVDAGRTIIGTGTTVLSGNGGTAAGVFSNLAITGRIILSGAVSTTGNLTLGNASRLELNGQSLIVGGQLISTRPDGSIQRIVPVVIGPGSTFIVAGVAVNGLLLQNAPLTINGGTLLQFDDVWFNGFAPEAVQLTVNHNGQPDTFTMNALSFSTTPTTGRLVQANDTNDGANALVLDIFGAVPANGAAFTGTAGGAIVNWLFNPGEANLAVVQSVSPVPAAAGSTLTYTIAVINGGPAAATNVTLHPGIPFGATNVSIMPGQGECTSTSGGWVCSLGTIPAGAGVTTIATFVPAATGTFETTASVTASEADSVSTNNVHTVGATVVEAGGGVNLSIAKSASAVQASIGTSFTYSVTVTNAGATPANNVLVVDPIPANVTITAPTSTQGTCATVAGQVQCSLGTLAAGQVVTITLPASATAAGLITNAAIVTSSEVELSPLDNLATHQMMVVATAGCSATTFTGPVSYAGSPGPMAVVRLVDMDHDGDLDAVATHEIGGGGVDVFLNDGTGQFLAPRFTSTVTSPWVHVVADFNGDTHPDVIVATDTTGLPNPTTLRLLTNDGTGMLTLVPTFSIPFGGSVEAVDIERDGDPDLVTSSTEGDVVLLRNDGAGNFAAPVTLFSGENQGAGAFGDYNGDNRTDMVVALGAAGYAVLLADATGGFLPPVVHAVDGGALFVSAGDINGDGFVDLLIPEGSDEDSPSGRTSFALGNGAGGFGEAVEIATDNFFFPTVADLNRDGRTDLLAFSSLGSFEVRIGDGTGGFSAPLRFANANYYWPAVDDLNGDSRPDIAIGDRNGMLNVFLNNCGAAPTNLSVTVSESADPVNEGDELTYTVTVTNQTAAEATGVRLTSVLSPALTDDEQEEPNVEVLATTSSGGGNLTVSGRTYGWFLPAVPGNSTVTFLFAFRPLTGGTLELTSGVTSEGAETDVSDNAAFASTTVTPAGRNIEVTNTDDSGPGSLRQAIIDSNADSGDRDTIVFNIPGAGVRTITLLTPLPNLSEPVIIDGLSQPGSAAGTPLIELNGNGVQGSGLAVLAPGATIRGLVINRFGFTGISVGPAASNTVVEGNFIGTNATGTAALPNLLSGVFVQSANNRIGGETVALRNVLSGNQQTGVVITGAAATGNSVQNNYIGTDASGTASVPNDGVQSGVTLSNGASNNTVANNVVSGNRQHGITVIDSTSNGNRIVGNLVGTDATGMVLIGNGIGVGAIGVDIVGAQNTIIGDADGRNVIAGNTNAGIQMRTGASGTLVQNNYIGVNAAGTAAIANGTGILIQDAANGNTIGGAAPGLGNVISGSTSSAVRINNNVTGTQVVGNRIGTNAAGTAAVPNQTGVNITASNNSVLGNLISGNAQNGIVLGAVSTSNTIQGNLIGTDVSGALDLGNGVDGVQIEGTGNLIGGTTAGARNVISGNQSQGVQIRTGASGNTVQGNYIGLNLGGTSAIGNGAYGVSIAGTNNTVGGTATGAGNVLSGNGLSGVNIAEGANPPATGNQIVGNRIGTDASGEAAVPNVFQGVIVFQGPNTIGGNLISGNLQNGVLVAASGLTIRGNLIGTNATGTSALPNGNHGISLGGNSQGNEVGGDVSGAGNVISGNTWDGVFLSGNLTAGNLIRGNLIGTSAAGTAALGNRRGIVFSQGASANTVGGSTPAARNIVSGNAAEGILLQDSLTTDNSIAGNYIGTNSDGTGPIPNLADGLSVGGARDNVIGGTAAGTGNLIAFNGGNGVEIASGNGNRITGNSIRDNVQLGIDLGAPGPTPNDTLDADLGANNLQNFPLVTSATANGASLTVQGTLHSLANTTFRIELFGGGADPSGFGEGAVFLGALSVMTDANGDAPFTIEVPRLGVTNVTATAEFDGSTSEFGPSVAVSVGQQTFTVTNTNDSGPGSLRQAILDANTSIGTRDTIAFDIGGTAPYTISPQSPLPTIADPVVIDGTTEPDFAGAPVIELVGSNAGQGTPGLNITAGNTAVRGLVINRFVGDGILISSGNGNTITGNYIGTDVTGTLARPNLTGGITTSSSGNVIGGATASLRNIVSGNVSNGINLNGGSGNTVQGNYVGLDVTGTAPLSNGAFGISVFGSQTNVIGGAGAGEGNVVADATSINISLQGGAHNNIIQGNRVGTNAAGTAVVGANQNGVYLIGSNNNLIGGTTPGARNVIAGSTGTGNVVIGNGSTNNTVQGNYIGTNADGTAGLANGTWGIQLGSPNNIIGGTEPGAGNVISANNVGGIVFFGAASGNSVLGNLIGTAADGLTPLPNQGYGIGLQGPSANTIGSAAGGGNVIAFNTGAGIAAPFGAQNQISGNRIFDNGGLGIDLGTAGVTPNDTDDTDAGANGLQNFPVLSSPVLTATQLSFTATLNSVAGRAYTIEYFRSAACDASGFGEGAVPAGTTTTGPFGNPTAAIPVSFGSAGFAVGQFLTATATSSDGTSEFSSCVQIMAAPSTFTVTTTDDSGAGSLRQAILDSNATAGALDTIGFNIPGPGPHSIALLSALPTITDAVVIDGTTEPDYAGIPVVELNGTNAGGDADGLRVIAANSTIRGLAINGFGTGGSGGGGAGLVIDGANTVLEGNFVGTHPAGHTAVANRTAGIVVTSSGNRIGGSTFAETNVISGNGGAGLVLVGSGATSNLVQRNFIGTGYGGSTAVANAAHGVLIADASDNTVLFNIIGFNGGDGVNIGGGVDNDISGNNIFSNGGLGVDLGLIVDFEDQADDIAVGTAFPSSYRGITWNNWRHYAPYPAPYQPSGRNAIYAAADGASFTFSPRVFSGAAFSRFVGQPGDIFFELYLNGGLVWTSAILSDAPPALTFLPSGYSGLVDEVRVRSLGQTIVAGGSAWVMDNVTFDDGPTANDEGDGDAGPNGFQNHPVVTGVAGGVQIALDSTPSTSFRVDLFITSVCDPTGSGEGETFVGSLPLDTDASGQGSFIFPIGAGVIVTTTATNPSGSTSEFSPCAIAQATTPADLSLTKTDSQDPVVVNTPFSYTVTISNAGPGPATNVTLSDVLPAGVTVTSATSTAGACDIQPTLVTCTIPSLPAGATAVITLSATASQSGLASNQVFVFGNEPDPNVVNNSAIEQTMVLAFEACGAPSLSGPVLFAAGGTATHLASGDLNEDGAADLIVSYGESSQVGVLLSNGAGGFGPATPIVVASGPPSGARHVTPVDTNNDGHLDLVVSNTSANTITVATGDGAGGFLHTFTSAVLAGTPGKVTPGHFSEDGQLDIVVETPAGALMLLGDGSGGFLAPASIGSGTNAPLFAGHFNPDTQLDVVLGSTGASNVRVFNGNGSGGFTNVTLYPTNVPSKVVGVADVTGDGRADVLLESLLTPGLLTLLHSTTVGLGAETGIGTGLFLSQIADVNGDGRQDLIVSGSVSVLLGNGDGTFSAPLRLAESPNADAAGDFNSDGRIDFAGISDDSVAVLLNTCGQPETNLAIQLTDTLDPVTEGVANTYTATITNTGSVGATGVRLTVSADAGGVELTFSAVDPACVVQGNGLLCNIGPVPAGTDRLVEFDLTTAGATTVNVRASVTGEQAETTASDNSDLEPTTVNSGDGNLRVTNTNDSGAGSLRQAILDSNGDSGDTDRVVFAISGPGPHTINLASALPIITQPIEIDGTTQPGYAGTPVIELNGAALAGIPQAGLNITAGNSTVRGLAINRFSGDGIVLSGAGGNAVYSSYVGVGPAGNVDLGNAGNGILVGGSANNVIGGPGQGNVIAGNTIDGVRIQGLGSTGNVVAGNRIGTNAAGSAAIPNNAGVFITNSAGASMIGGSVSGAGNLISGNAGMGVWVQGGANGTSIQGNVIGLSVDGATDLGNGFDGVLVQNAQGAVIGGTTDAARNVISGNGTAGVRLTGTTTGTAIQGNYIGTDAAAGAAVGNSEYGVRVENGANGNTIGGTVAGAGNVISGNANAGVLLVNVTNTLVQGNRIGTDALATTAIRNVQGGVLIQQASQNTIGGPAPEARNVISGNGANGVFVSTFGGAAAGNVIQNNFIGTNGSATSAIPNLNHGIRIDNATDTQVGPGNVVSGNGADGIQIFGTVGAATVVVGNHIGTNVFATAAVPNTANGIQLVTSSVAVGGPTLADGNIIGGNGQNGIVIGNGGTGNVIRGNRIGLVEPPNELGNGLDGVRIVLGSNNTIGGIGPQDGNAIAFNDGDGVFVQNGSGNRILGNRIANNGGLGVDLGIDGITANDAGDADAGPNNLQNFPVLAAEAGGVTGTLNSTPDAAFRLEFFVNAACDPSGVGEGESLLGAIDVTTDANGAAAIPLFATDSGLIVTATATNASGDTSEFSGCVTVPTSLPTVTLTIDNPNPPEAAGQPATFTFTRTGPTTLPLEVQYSISGSNIGGDDYTPALTASVTIPSGASSVDLALTPVNDAEPEGPQVLMLTVVPTLSNTYQVGSPDSATMTIVDDDSATIVATDATAAELGTDTATFIINRGPGESQSASRQVSVAIGGTANHNAGDYTITATVPVLVFSTRFELTIPAGQASVTVTATPGFQPEVEGAETIVFTLEGSQATATIADEPSATIAVTDASAAELGNDTATFVISRAEGASTAYDRYVSVDIAGTANHNTDYTITASVPGNVFSTRFELFIPAGQSSVTVTATPMFQADVEGPETIVFTLEGTSAAATIADEPSATIAVTDASAAELGNDTATFVISRAAGASTAYDRYVSVDIGGTANHNAGDYTIIASVPGNVFSTRFELFIPAGQSSVTVTVTPADEGLAEGPESVIFTLEGTSAEASIADAPTVRSWISDADGFWDEPANWSGAVVPQPGEHVVIDRPGVAVTVTVRNGETIGSLRSEEHIVFSSNGSLILTGDAQFNGGMAQGGGGISTQGAVTIGGTSTWTSSQISAAGGMTILNGASLAVDTPNAGGSLNVSITNNGRLIWNQTGLSFGAGVRIVNNAGGIFEIQSNLPMAGGGAPTAITNAGTLIKSGPVGPLTLNGIDFVNTGTLVVRLGETVNDSINSDSPVTLGGTLDVRLEGTFVPTPGAQFSFITAANGTLAGTFGNVVGNGQTYLVEYSPTAATLTAGGGVINSFAAWHAAATGPLRVIDFESGPTLPTGTILAGTEYETRGLTIIQRDSDPMRIVAAGDGTFASVTNFNSQTHGVSSSAAPGFPGGLDNTRSENYDFVFTRLVQSAGIWIGNLNPESTVTVQFLDGAGTVLQSIQPTSTHPQVISGPGGPWDNRLFVGLHATTAINRIRVINAAGDNDGILFDDVVFISNVAPVANAGPDQNDVAAGSPVTLDGRLSSDADVDTLAYAWDFVARPTGSSAVLNDATAATPSFTPDVAGVYRIRLVVSDGFASAEDTVDVTTVAPPPGEQAFAGTTGVSYYNPARVRSPDGTDSTRASLSYHNPAQITTPGSIAVANRASVSYYNPAPIPRPGASESAGASVSYFNPAELSTSGMLVAGRTSVSYHNPAQILTASSTTSSVTSVSYDNPVTTSEAGTQLNRVGGSRRPRRDGQ